MPQPMKMHLLERAAPSNCSENEAVFYRIFLVLLIEGNDSTRGGGGGGLAVNKALHDQ